jgi:hypothetical protein
MCAFSLISFGKIFKLCAFKHFKLHRSAANRLVRSPRIGKVTSSKSYIGAKPGERRKSRRAWVNNPRRSTAHSEAL